eukprot:3763001-Pyramimonas_sp.AAC.1
MTASSALSDAGGAFAGGGGRVSREGALRRETKGLGQTAQARRAIREETGREATALPVDCARLKRQQGEGEGAERQPQDSDARG